MIDEFGSIKKYRLGSSRTRTEKDTYLGREENEIQWRRGRSRICTYLTTYYRLWLI